MKLPCVSHGRGGKGIKVYPLDSIGLGQSSGSRALTYQQFLLYMLGDTAEPAGQQRSPRVEGKILSGHIRE